MSVALKVVGLNGEETFEPYLLRVPGWTEELYFREAPETRIAEFEDGELIMHSPANIRHQQIVAFVTVLLRTFVRARRLGDVLNGPAVVQLRLDLDYEPDIFFMATEQLDRLEEQRFSGAPRLVIEVISPGSRKHDLERKAANYRAHGVLEYWALDPEQKRVYQHVTPDDPSAPYDVITHTHGRIESRVVPGSWIEADWLWQDPLPSELDCLERILAGS